MPTLKNKLALITFLIIFLQIILSYKGLRISYDIYNYENLKNFYNNDIFFNTEGKASTMLYYLIPFNLNNDFIGIFIHILFSITGFYYAFKIINKIFFINYNYSLFLIIVLGYISHFILPEVKSELATTGYSWGSSYAHSLSYALSYYTLKKNIKLVPLIFFTLLLSFKYSALICLFCILYCLIDYKKNIKLIVFSLSSFLLSFFILYSKVNKLETLDAADVLFVIKNYILTQGNESFILENKIYHLIIFFAFLIIYTVILQKVLIKKDLKFFLYTLFFFSITLIFFNILFQLYFYKLFTSTSILILDVVIFLKLIQFFIITLIIKFLLEKKINHLSIFILFLFIIFWRWSSDYYFLSKKTTIIIFIFFLLSLFINSKLKKINLFKNRYFIIVSGIIIVMPFLYSNLKYSIKNFNTITIKKINKFYYYEKDPKFLDFLMELKKKNDFEMVYLKKRDNKLVISLDENFLTKKSKFTVENNGDCRFFKTILIKECHLRLSYTELLFLDLTNKIILPYNDFFAILCECNIYDKNFMYKKKFFFDKKIINLYTNNKKVYDEIKIIAKKNN